MDSVVGGSSEPETRAANRVELLRRVELLFEDTVEAFRDELGKLEK
jgi:hypothetical protein